MAADETIGAVQDLLSAADTDLAGYRSAAPEASGRLLAGRGALHGIEAAIARLMELRANLLAELIGVYAVWDRPDVPSPEPAEPAEPAEGPDGSDTGA